MTTSPPSRNDWRNWVFRLSGGKSRAAGRLTPAKWPARCRAILAAPKCQVDLCRQNCSAWAGRWNLAGQILGDDLLAAGFVQANRARLVLDDCATGYSGPPRRCPLWKCSSRKCSRFISAPTGGKPCRAGRLAGRGSGARQAGKTSLMAPAVRIFWVNPVADLRVMNLLEEAGGRICGSDYMFTHALDLIPENLPPMEALARMALADPMVGSPLDRARRIADDVRRFGAEAVVISRIPGASHCALEGRLIAEIVAEKYGVPVLEIEVPPLSDALEPALRTRLEALVETVRQSSRHTPCAVRPLC